MKRSTTFIAALLLAFALFAIPACARQYTKEQPPKPGERAAHIWFNVLNKSKHPVFLKYKGKVNMGSGKKEDTVTTLAMKGDMTFTDLKGESDHMSMIHNAKDNKTMVVMHKDKTYMVMTARPETVQTVGATGDVPEEKQKAQRSVEAGQETINGRKYDYDKITIDGSDTQTYYFNEMTDEWKYWRTHEDLLEILEYGSKVDDGFFIFKVPAGYTEIKMP
ncbi:MAG: DUF4412 domain-containing protein [Synergistaceae bacterium]|nr:DUF4412 domain-containing protein [Synergistaceae bacterium]